MAEAAKEIKERMVHKMQHTNRPRPQIHHTGRMLPRFRFMAMSKLIGIITFGFVFIVTIYAMYEMHISQDYSTMGQLIISAYGFASVYAGFYLLMAKVEHVEEERTKREKELASLKKENASEEEIAEKKNEILALVQKMNEMISETTGSLL